MKRAFFGVLLAVSSGGASAATINVRIVNRAFVPATVVIHAGDTVKWVNEDSGSHTVTDDAAKANDPSFAEVPAGVVAFDSGNITGGASWSHTFTVVGSYKYFCIPHEAHMRGGITVQAATP